ncbi:MAG: hypothetical protein KZQ94_20910 [Candidatus Thiodiazotropha sp. (ex Troendleina suluensis)]|nr:hypothetical protein [Candidatus Thiodiazotropha sp. (ex Troendleina suluensis)]
MSFSVSGAVGAGGRKSIGFNGTSVDCPIDGSYSLPSESKTATTPAGNVSTILDVEGQGELDVLTSRTITTAAVARVTVTVDGVVSYFDTDGVSAATHVLLEPRNEPEKSPSIKFSKTLKIEVDNSAGSQNHLCNYRYWVI